MNVIPGPHTLDVDLNSKCCYSTIVILSDPYTIFVLAGRSGSLRLLHCSVLPPAIIGSILGEVSEVIGVSTTSWLGENGIKVYLAVLVVPRSFWGMAGAADRNRGSAVYSVC